MSRAEPERLCVRVCMRETERKWYMPALKSGPPSVCVCVAQRWYMPALKSGPPSVCVCVAQRWYMPALKSGPPRVAGVQRPVQGKCEKRLAHACRAARGRRAMDRTHAR